jgi:cell division protein FtsA
MCELGDEVFHVPVRIGVPVYQGPLADVVSQPQYANVMGLVLEGAAQRRRGLQARETRSLRHSFERMKAWFEKNF